MIAMFQKKTVAGVLAQFHKTLEDLDNVRQDNLNEAHQQETIASEAITKANAARREADEALAVSERLSALINGKAVA